MIAVSYEQTDLILNPRKLWATLENKTENNKEELFNWKSSYERGYFLRPHPCHLFMDPN